MRRFTRPRGAAIANLAVNYQSGHSLRRGRRRDRGRASCLSTAGTAPFRPSSSEDGSALTNPSLEPGGGQARKIVSRLARALGNAAKRTAEEPRRDETGETWPGLAIEAGGVDRLMQQARAHFAHCDTPALAERDPFRRRVPRSSFLTILFGVSVGGVRRPGAPGRTFDVDSLTLSPSVLDFRVPRRSKQPAQTKIALNDPASFPHARRLRNAPPASTLRGGQALRASGPRRAAPSVCSTAKSSESPCVELGVEHRRRARPLGGLAVRRIR